MINKNIRELKKRVNNYKDYLYGPIAVDILREELRRWQELKEFLINEHIGLKYHSPEGLVYELLGEEITKDNVNE